MLIFFVLRSGIWLRGRITRGTAKVVEETSSNAPSFTSDDPSTCRQIIAGTFRSPKGKNTLSPHESRALPNHRLKIAFGIDNAFTQKDSTKAAAFVTKTRKLINLSSDDWVVLSQFTRIVASVWMEKGFSQADVDLRDGYSVEKSPDPNRISITSMVQALTLKSVFLVIFRELDQNEVSDISFIKLAHSITRIWIASKLSPDDSKAPRFEDDKELQEALFEIFGIRNLHPTNNPLNLILPSFETMWRVVLRAVLEIGVGSGIEHPGWKKTIIAFAMNTTKEQFERSPYSTRSRSKPPSIKDDTGANDPIQALPSAKDLVCESLRLYVPTRRVHRAYRWSHEMRSGEMISADIEGCHLQSEIWGVDAMKFNPTRWSALTTEQKAAFMPFGCVPFECPAKPTFGPRMIGLLTGSLLGALESRSKGGWRLECEDKNVVAQLKSGGRLDSGRNAYECLYLVRCETKGASKLK
jgi:hypothetical protein